jgi:hypothetical protein
VASAIPGAKSALRAIAAAAVPDIPVYYGSPGTLEPWECVWIDDIAPMQETASFSQVSHRETFEVPVVVSITRGDADHEAAEARAWALADPIADAIRAAPDLNGAPGVTAALVTGKFVLSDRSDAGVEVNVIINVTVRSRT